MPRRLSRRYLEARLKAVAQALNWRTEPRWLATAVDGRMEANPFIVYIAHASGNGKFHVNMTLNKDGFATSLTGSHRGYTAGELDAWFAGILFCKATLSEPQGHPNPLGEPGDSRAPRLGVRSCKWLGSDTQCDVL